MWGDGGAGKEAKRARAEEEARQGRIKAGTRRVRESFGKQFDDNYYSKLLKDYTGAYDTDIQTQYKDAYQAMQASLLRSGLFDSSEAARREKMATAALDKAKAGVTQQGLAAQNQRKQDVAYSENSVLSQLANTADSDAAFANASARIRDNTAPLVTPMLGQVFTDLSAGLATQADLERQGQARYNVFGRIPGWSSGRYTSNVGGR